MASPRAPRCGRARQHYHGHTVWAHLRRPWRCYMAEPRISRILRVTNVGDWYMPGDMVRLIQGPERSYLVRDDAGPYEVTACRDATDTSGLRLEVEVIERS